ncbi:M15 family metallopeptidase [Elizabethkingia phage TCUEAP1]|nr:M15 family metallopeptidase [Elizabethkingia phage TCUEAP1]
MDKTTEKVINTLHPSVRAEVTKLVNEANAILSNGPSQVRLTQGLRTFAEQDALYAQGRTKVGKKVTDAKGGQSVHNYGFAVDFVLIIDGKTAAWDIVKDFNRDGKSDWLQVAEVFKRGGWEWGGDWKSFKDYPHFQKKGFGNWRELQLKKRDASGYIII